jgi:hypothetical protein
MYFAIILIHLPLTGEKIKMLKQFSSTTLFSLLMLSTSLSGTNCYGQGDLEYEDQKSKRAPTIIDLATLPKGKGFAMLGDTKNADSGYTVFSGDPTNSGKNVFVIGSANSTPTYNGTRAHVVYDKVGPFGYEDIDLIDLNQKQGLTIQSNDLEGDLFGYAVTYVNNINGDGKRTLVIGAPGTNNNAGAVYGIYAWQGEYPGALLELDDLTPQRGFKIFGNTPDDGFGAVLSSGDLDGDGKDELIVAAPGFNSYTGKIYVFKPWIGNPGVLNPDSLTPAQGVVFTGAVVGDTFGSAVTCADLDGDGKDEVIVGASGADPGGRNFAVQTVVVRGKSPLTNIMVSSLPSTDGYLINGENAGDSSGTFVSCGDIDGNGTPDILTGATDNPGTVFVVTEFPVTPTNIELATLPSAQGFRINGASGDGIGVSGIVVNIEGIPYVIIGAPSAAPNGKNAAGKTYMLEGPLTGNVELGSSAGAVQIYGDTVGGFSGNALAQVGPPSDFQGLLIGAFRAVANGNTGAGKTHFVSWKALVPPSTTTGTTTTGTPTTGMTTTSSSPTSGPTSGDGGGDGGSAGDGSGKGPSSAASSLQTPWYSPARWVETMKSLWQGPELDLADPQVAALVSLRTSCESLKAKSHRDAWYGYSLEDLAEDITATLKETRQIDQATVAHFKKRLGGIHHDFRSVSSQEAGFKMMNPALKEALMPSASTFELLSAGYSPLLTSGTVVYQALGK